MGPACFSHFLTTIQACKIQCFTVIATIVNLFLLWPCANYKIYIFLSLFINGFAKFHNLIIFAIFVIFAVSYRTFLGLIYVSSSLFVNGHAKFHYFHNFHSTFVKFCDFCKFPNRVQSWKYSRLKQAIHVFRWLIWNTVCLKSGSEVNRIKHTTMKIN